MESPVLQALANAKLQQEATTFGRWCIKKGVRCLPAMPAHVALFVRECEPVIETICAALEEISRSHIENGHADPCAGGVVAEACSAVAKIEPPRSWSSFDMPIFEQLPYHLQVRVAEREKQRDTALRRAQNKLAEERAAIQQQQETKTNAITKKSAA